MRVLFLGLHFPRPNNPTIGTWALHQLLALRARGIECTVISPVAAVPKWVTKLLGRGTSACTPSHHRWKSSDAAVTALYPRWPVYPVGPLKRVIQFIPGPFLWIGWLYLRKFLLAQLRLNAPEIIFAHHGEFCGYLAKKLSQRAGIPYVITEHSFGEIESCKTKPLRRRHYEYALAGVSQWLAVASEMQGTMRAVFPQIPSAVLHNGAVCSPSNERIESFAQRFVGNDVIFCAAFFYRRKNVPLLVEAFDAVAHRFPSALLAIAGSGEDLDKVLCAISHAKSKERILYLGHLAHEDVLAMMHCAIAFANIGVREPFATTFSESMLAGCPILYSRDGGICDVVADGVHGLAVDPDNLNSASTAIATMLGDLHLREQLGQNAKKLASENLTWSKNASELEAMFSNILIRNRSAD